MAGARRHGNIGIAGRYTFGMMRPDAPTGKPLPEPIGAGTEPPPFKVGRNRYYERAAEATARNAAEHAAALAPRRYRP